jgi:hypothetical protein
MMARGGLLLATFLLASQQGGGVGLRGEYFDSDDFKDYRATRLDAQVNFDWGSSAPMRGVRADGFAVRWTGEILPLFSETYTFTAETDDGCRLWVGDKQLVDKWDAVCNQSGAIDLKGGEKVPIKMEMRDTGGGARAKLHWQSPSQKKEIVPRSQLFPALKGEAERLKELAKEKAKEPANKPPEGPPPVDQKRVDEAIARGVQWLKGAGSPGNDRHTNADELIFLTLIHAGVGADDPKYQDLLNRILTAPLERIYKTSLQAMCLEEIDRVKHQGRLYHCAQFIVDNQMPDGRWCYGEPTVLPPVPKDESVATSTAPKLKEFGGGTTDAPVAKPGDKPPPKRTIKVRRQRDGNGADSDNSNSQYAALGIRACFDAGVIVPEEAIARAVGWLQKSVHEQERDKGPYSGRGWAYRTKAEGDAYGSMTAGAVGALVIYDYILKRDWKKNPLLREGVAWLGAHFTVTQNFRRNKDWYHYYLYGLERAGVLFDTDKFGAHWWYAEGAEELLRTQNPAGYWEGSGGSNKEWDTCFAILFLKKATRRIDVATVGAGGNKDK